MNTSNVYFPNPRSAEEFITLEKEVSAMELIRNEKAGRFGGIAPLPKGSRIEICGSGFNDRTYKVRCEDRLFFVFKQDVSPVYEP